MSFTFNPLLSANSGQLLSMTKNVLPIAICWVEESGVWKQHIQVGNKFKP